MNDDVRSEAALLYPPPPPSGLLPILRPPPPPVQRQSKHRYSPSLAPAQMFLAEKYGSLLPKAHHHLQGKAPAARFDAALSARLRGLLPLPASPLAALARLADVLALALGDAVPALSGDAAAVAAHLDAGVALLDACNAITARLERPHRRHLLTRHARGPPWHRALAVDPAPPVRPDALRPPLRRRAHPRRRERRLLPGGRGPRRSFPHRLPTCLRRLPLGGRLQRRRRPGLDAVQCDFTRAATGTRVTTPPCFRLRLDDAT
jgi:hypothetical protein